MWKKGIAKTLLTTVRIAVLVFAFLCLLYVVKDRYDTFMKNGIVMRRYISRFQEPWFEVAVCFGPKIPGDLVDRYMNRTSSLDPERYRSYRSWNDQAKRTETYFRGAMAVDSVSAYRQFFTDGGFNWTDGVLGISSMTPSLLSQHLDGIQHRLSIGGEEVHETVLRHTDIPFLLQYAICRNYSYNITYPAGYSGTLEHQIYMNASVYEALFETAWYIDLYVYPGGNFTEFPLIADHIPYRVDFRSHQLLEVIGKKTEKMLEGGHSVHSASQTYVNCLTWCLARGFLDQVTCIMPMQIPYIYNTSGRIPEVNFSLAGEDELTEQWRRLHPPSAAWPWMARYTHLPLCRSAEEFAATFDKFSQVYFPRGHQRYPLSPQCGRDCPRRCDEYAVVIHPAGTELVPGKKSVDDDSHHNNDYESVHSVTFYHSTTLTVSRQNWIYEAWEFFVDVSGMTSFVMGLSVIAIYDWGFLLIQWALHMVGLEEIEYMREEEEEEEGEQEKKEEWQMWKEEEEKGWQDDGLQVVEEEEER